MFTIIEGDGPGIGKTSLAAAMGVADMTVYAAARVALCRREVKAKNKIGYNLTIPKKHIVYADFKIESRVPGHPRRRSYDIDGFSFALPNPFFETTYEPPFSTVILDEARKYYSSTSGKRVSKYVYMKYQLHRHYGLKIILTCLRNEELDKNIRPHATCVIYVTGQKHKHNRHGELIRTTWSGWEFKDCFQATRYKEKGEIGRGKKFSYIFNGNIYKCYNSFNHDEEHYRRGKDFDLSQNKHVGHSIEAPLGFYGDKKEENEK